MPSKVKAPSFGSQEYWDQRFTTNTAPFDWLSAPDALDSFIQEALQDTSDEAPQILHVGCGSSLLSQHLKIHVDNAHQIHNIDYSTVVIEAERQRELSNSTTGMGQKNALMRWDAVDLLDHDSITMNCKRAAYSVVIDKSTSDAISCADDVVCPLPYPVVTESHTDIERPVAIEPKEIPVHPLHIMAVHLAFVTKPGARWIALSYNSERYPFFESSATDVEEDGTLYKGIPDSRLLWTVVSKHQVEAEQRDNSNGLGVTHRPKVNHWVYVLQRTSMPLLIRGE